MGCMLRCDVMTLCDVYLQPEAAFEIISKLGEASCVQFLDMKAEASQSSRTFYPEIKRCAEMERKLRFIESEMSKEKINVLKSSADSEALQPNEMNTFENELEKVQIELTEMSVNYTNLMKNFLEMTELYYVLTEIGPILGDADIKSKKMFSKSAGGGDISVGHLEIVAGVVRRTKYFAFQMMLWRIARGNIHFRAAAQDKILFDPSTGNEIRKVAFVAVCQGDELISRVQKICNGFHANVYACPESYEDRTSMISKLQVRLDDLEQVIKKTQYHRCKALRVVAKKWFHWMSQVMKAKAVYHYMNYFTLDITKKCLIGQCWIPTLDLPIVQNILKKSSEIIETNVPSFVLETQTDETPPTYNRTNKYTQGFQALINAYGDSSYREVNPGLYTIITFPFLFAIMFGDFGHGLIIVVFGAWMIINEKKFSASKSSSEIWNIFFGGRYVIFLMGVFSMYTGFIYNDCFSKAFNILGSNWKNTFTVEELKLRDTYSLDPKIATIGSPYKLGVDPCWALAPKNKILHDNSVKMKMSIIIGTIHMLFGLSLGILNDIFFKRKVAIILEFIPQFLFMSCLLLWLVFLIYFKWWNYGALADDMTLQPGCAPMILILFIDMMLMSTSKPVEEDCEAYMIIGQKTIQMSLLVLALLCIPIILLAMPIYQAKKKGVSFGEIMTHQAIHTIEFVLSTISHTASYLRLWALSLAHTQLTEMLWVMILNNLALQDRTLIGVPKLFLIFAIWAGFSLSILVMMEGMSAFLHTLRLHWVEFMSKFFIGGGVPFVAFSFKYLNFEEKKERG